MTSITILHRGDFLTPAGLSQIDRVIASSVGESTDPVVSVAGAFKQALGVDDISSASQEQIDAVAAQPEFAALLDSLSGEADGEALVIRWLERAAASSA